MIESNKEVNTPEALKENETLLLFLPKQLDLHDITFFIKKENFQSIGDCMKWFKENYEGLYNGKEVSIAFQKMQ